MSTDSSEPTDFTRWWRETLTVRHCGGDSYEAGPAPSAFPRLYGGQLASQCLVAAASTVDEDRQPNSVQTVFLRGGDISRPVQFEVERVRESRTLSTRLIRAEQDGQVLATATASFFRQVGTLEHILEHDIGEGEWQGAPSVDQRPPAADPASLDSRHQAMSAAYGGELPHSAAAIWPADMRYVDRTPWDPGASNQPCNRLWLRALGTLPDVRARDAAALTFAADYPMFEPTYFPHDVDWTDMISGRSVYGASLDHSLWFHRPIRFDEWLLVDVLVPVATGARSFSRAEIRNTSNQLVCSVVQEICFVTPRT